MMHYQRTGLTEGSLIYNNWLKEKGLYREDTEARFINWLYSTSGWYDKDISGSYFDINVEAVKKSDNYQRFLKEFTESLKGSEWFHLMLHSSYHINGLEISDQFASQFSVTNTNYWNNKELLQKMIDGKRVLVISSIAPIIAEKYGVLGYHTPTTHLNTGELKNSWETLDKVTRDIENLKPQFDVAIVSFGAYGCLLVDRIVKMGKDALTIGSGIYEFYPVEQIPVELKPAGWERIEDGRYWK